MYSTYFNYVIIILVMTSSFSEAGGRGRSKSKRSDRKTYSRYLLPTSEDGNWGSWGYWNPCTKTCAGGLSMQTRTCYKESTSSQRIPYCPGPYKRHRICNVLPCPGVLPPNTHKARCQFHTSQLFRDKTSEWEAVNKDDPCDMKCRSTDKRFYYRHPTTLTNGMSCNYDNFTQGFNFLKVCVDGKCLTAGCDGLVGSGVVKDRCGVCGGTGNTCQYEEGEFRSNRLPPGHLQLVVTVPVGATRINITEKAPSRNVLALKQHGENGRHYLNMDLQNGVLSKAGPYRIAGSIAIYKRPMTIRGESILIEGPINQALDVMLMFQQDNPGIHYTYLMPLASTSSVDLDTGGRFDLGNNRPVNPYAGQQGRLGVMPPRSRYNPYRRLRPPFNSAKKPMYPQRPYGSPYVPRKRPVGTGRIPQTQQTGLNRPAMDVSPNYKPATNALSFKPVTNSESLDEDDSSNLRRDAQVINIHQRYGEDGLIPPEEEIDEDEPPTQTTGITSSSPSEDVAEISLEESASISIANLLWKSVGFKACTKTCAGGVQVEKLVCFSSTRNATIRDVFCRNVPRPRLRMKNCNRFPCPAYYDVAKWSKCSQTCGLGRRSRRVVCRQKFPGNFTTVVSHKRCRKMKKPRSHERCMVQRCAQWHVDGPWSECNVKCGKGKQVRKAICKTATDVVLADSKCSGLRRPALTRICSAVPCVSKWFYSDWGTCTGDCANAQQTRQVKCVNTINGEVGCRETHTPPPSQTCSKASCGERYDWFSGSWGGCTAECGSGTQTRRVVCIRVTGEEESVSIADTDNCDHSTKPVVQQACNTQECGSRWFFTDWGDCSKTCDGGNRERLVWCLNDRASVATGCRESEKPVTEERCNVNACVEQTVDPDCYDHMSSCAIVGRAGLCTNQYYNNICCNTCSKMNKTS